MGAYRAYDERTCGSGMDGRARPACGHCRERARYGVRKRRLLAPSRSARAPQTLRDWAQGSAVLESIFALLLLLILVLGAIQVTFVLYARNVVAASAHEGARAAVELGRNANDARIVASDVVRSSAGGLVEQMQVAVSVQSVGDLSIVRVRVIGRLKSFGVVPVRIPVNSVATSIRREAPV